MATTPNHSPPLTSRAKGGPRCSLPLLNISLSIVPLHTNFLNPILPPQNPTYFIHMHPKPYTILKPYSLPKSYPHSNSPSPTFIFKISSYSSYPHSPIHHSSLTIKTNNITIMERDSEYELEEETLSDSSMERFEKQKGAKKSMINSKSWLRLH